MIIRRKGGYPVALNTNNKQTWSIDEIEELAQDNQMYVKTIPTSETEPVEYLHKSL